MIRRFSGGWLLLGIVVAWSALAAEPAALPASPSEPEIVMSGLENPRGLAIGPEGALYVAEAGKGGSGPCAFVSGPARVVCYGPTGAISRLRAGRQRRVLTELPSHVSDTGEAGGPNDISFQSWFGAYITMSLGGSPADREGFGPVGKMFGTLVHVFRFPFGRPRIVADLAAYEEEADPDGDGHADSNPFGLLIRPFSRLVADAGGNAIVRVGIFGGISTLAVLPPVAVPPPFNTADPVPTSIVKGPDGAYYIGQLTGVPFAAGVASVYRLEPGGEPTVFLEGFKTIIDLDFGPDGSLYVLEHAGGPVFFGLPGRVVRIAPDGTRTFPVEGLTRPTSVLVDCKGTLYVTNHGVEPGKGEVLRVRGVSDADHFGHRRGC